MGSCCLTPSLTGAARGCVTPDLTWAALELGTHGCFPLSLLFLTLCPFPWLALDHLVLESQGFLVG